MSQEVALCCCLKADPPTEPPDVESDHVKAVRCVGSGPPSDPDEIYVNKIQLVEYDGTAYFVTNQWPTTCYVTDQSDEEPNPPPELLGNIDYFLSSCCPQVCASDDDCFPPSQPIIAECATIHVRMTKIQGSVGPPTGTVYEHRWTDIRFVRSGGFPFAYMKAEVGINGAFQTYSQCEPLEFYYAFNLLFSIPEGGINVPGFSLQCQGFPLCVGLPDPVRWALVSPDSSASLSSPCAIPGSTNLFTSPYPTFRMWYVAVPTFCPPEEIPCGGLSRVQFGASSLELCPNPVFSIVYPPTGTNKWLIEVVEATPIVVNLP